MSGAQRGFMSGRYGMDELNRLLLSAGIVAALPTFFFRINFLTIVLGLTAFILLLFACVRIFSRNFPKRQRELSRYLRYVRISGEKKTKRKKERSYRTSYNRKAYDASYKADSQGTDGAESQHKSSAKQAESPKASEQKKKDNTQYKFFYCPVCYSKMRVPAGKGNLVITCSYCGEKFEAKS